MKINSALLIAMIFSFFTIPWNAEAQARKLTERIVNPDNTLATPHNRPTPTPVLSQPRTPRSPAATNVVPLKTKAQKEEMLRKTIEFQKQRATAGAPTAQYDLGMRYLKGDGVEKNLDLAKKWLTASATNGNSQAVKRMEELTKK